MLSGSSEEEAYAIQIGQTEGAPSLQLVSQKRPAPLRLPAWIKAWNRFSAILSEQDTSVMVGLAHHMENVLNLADKKAGWRYYDEQFRHLTGSGMAPWGSAHLELDMKAHLKCPSTNNRAGNTPLAQQPLAKAPRGACFRYHSTRQCWEGIQCKLQHKCYNCLAGHPASCCPQPLLAPYKIMPRFLGGRDVGNTSDGQPFQYTTPAPGRSNEKGGRGAPQ